MSHHHSPGLGLLFDPCKNFRKRKIRNRPSRGAFIEGMQPTLEPAQNVTPPFGKSIFEMLLHKSPRALRIGSDEFIRQWLCISVVAQLVRFPHLGEQDIQKRECSTHVPIDQF